MKAHKLIMSLTVVALFFSACNSLEELTKSPLERSIDQIQKEWTVDTIRYVLYGIDGALDSDISHPTGKMIFGSLDRTTPDPKLFFNHGYVFHKYVQDGTVKTDTSSWTYGINSDVKLHQIHLLYKDGSDNTYSVGKTIYDVKEISDNKLYLYRDEMLMNIDNGQIYGRLKSTIRLHR
jgi:hypothetical protein